MATITKERHFELLRGALALAEERRAIPLREAAAAVGVDEATLRELLEPVLYLEFRTATGELVQEERAFLLTEAGDLVVTGDHWLRDLAADPPPPDVALRLLVAAVTIQAMAGAPTPDLDDAVKKLRGVVATELQVPIERPPCLAVAQEAWRTGRSLRVRYLAASSSAARELEILPHRVFCRWGHWYVMGRIPSETLVRAFRVDRMQSCELGDTEFDPPDDLTLPEWFDLSAHERTVRVRCAREALDVLPQPCRLGNVSDTNGDDMVEADLTVAGERRLDHLLVCLPPSARVVSPEEYNERRREHARELLALYEG